jgi:hypothetical protein
VSAYLSILVPHGIHYYYHYYEAPAPRHKESSHSSYGRKGKDEEEKRVTEAENESAKRTFKNQATSTPLHVQDRRGV